MEFQSPGAILCKLGPLTVRWYGVMIALGFLAATSAASKLAKRWQLDSDKIVNLTLFSFMGGIIGARLYFVALSWSQFENNLSEIFYSSREGLSIHGLSIHGGMIGALIVAFLYCKRAKLPVLRSIDIIATCVPLGQAIGRWGNFFNSEAFGRPVPDEFPLKLFIPMNARPLIFSNFQFFHPTFLYECVWDLLLFSVLYFYAADKLKKFPGLTFCVYIAAYSVGRLLIEPIRVDSIILVQWGVPAPIVVSAAMLAISVVGMLVIALINRQRPAAQ